MTQSVMPPLTGHAHMPIAREGWRRVPCMGKNCSVCYMHSSCGKPTAEGQTLPKEGMSLCCLACLFPHTCRHLGIGSAPANRTSQSFLATPCSPQRAFTLTLNLILSLCVHSKTENKVSHGTPGFQSSTLCSYPCALCTAECRRPAQADFRQPSACPRCGGCNDDFFQLLSCFYVRNASAVVFLFYFIAAYQLARPVLPITHSLSSSKLQCDEQIQNRRVARAYGCLWPVHSWANPLPKEPAFPS